MSLACDILDRIFFPDRDVHAIPVLDGGFSPNTRLEEAETLAGLESPDGVCVGADGTVYVSTGNRVVAFRGGDFSRPQTFAELDGAAGSLAAHPNGTVLVAVAGRGVVAFAGDGEAVARLERAGDAPLACVTAIAALADGSVALTDGSRANGPECWLHDLMQKRRGSGRLVACAADLSGARVVRDGLSWPAGVAQAPQAGHVLVTEAWSHRLLSLSLDGRGEDVLVRNFAGYPCRLTPASAGGFWVAFFAVRTQLTEFVLRETAFRSRMMETVPPELWIGPSLGGHFDYREPTQIGRIKKLGIQKPWAPPRSYGLVARLDEAGDAVESLHSRVSGSLHGITDLAEREGRLLLVSKGNGKLAAAAPSRGVPS